METAKRVDKTNYYLDIAQTVAARGTCLRRNFGAIIVKNDEIISTGYVGAPRGRQTAATWATAPAKNSTSPAASAMSCAARCTPRPMPSSARPAPR